MNVQEMLHRPTVERCIAELESGLDVHRWLMLWGSKGREVDESVAVAFYHQALQDAREALTALSTNKGGDE